MHKRDEAIYMYMYMTNHVHMALQSTEKEIEKEKKEELPWHTYIHQKYIHVHTLI